MYFYNKLWAINFYENVLFFFRTFINAHFYLCLLVCVIVPKKIMQWLLAAQHIAPQGE